MSNLLQWLSTISVLLGIWYSLLARNLYLNREDMHSWLIPVYAVIAFGLYSALVVLYRVYTFNDCVDAATELKMEIKNAKEDLQSKGFKFDT